MVKGADSGSDILFRGETVKTLKKNSKKIIRNWESSHSHLTWAWPAATFVF